MRRRTVLIEPSANLAALLTVPVPTLLGSNVPCDTTYLDGVRDQNALLTRLRAAAATPGPLLVYLSGRLTADRRNQLHLALAGTTAATARYTALPWEWLGTELRLRPPGLTTVVLDTAADKRSWPLLQEYGSLPAPGPVEVYGIVTPPGFTGPGDGHLSPYTRAWIEQLRQSTQRPPNSRLHALTVGTVALPPGTLVMPTTHQLAAPQAATGPAARPDPTSVQRILTADVIHQPGEHHVPAPEHGDVLTGDSRHLGRGATPDPQQPAGTPHVPAQQVPPVLHPVRQPPALGRQDPRPYIHALAQQGRFSEAASLAGAWEAHVLNTLGIGSPQAAQWVEIRADLAKQEGNYALATQLWISAGRTRLAHQSPNAPEALATGQSAHYCWTQITDAAEARECGPELLALLRALPGLDHRHLSMARQRLEHLNHLSDEH